ncbi:MAG TPA: hypothetical protein VFJ57_03260 [Solirubrobacterales bacterium]|nr:hypothetical protein [Solirubrobacterales bacterium]
MPGVIARCLKATAFLGAILGLLAATATGAGTTTGPRLSYVEWRLKEPMILRLATVAPNGSGRQVLTGRSDEPAPFAGASWSPDGGTLVFAGYLPGGGSKEGAEAGEPRLYVISADGGPAREIPGTVGASDPVFAPDGTSIAFNRAKLVQKINIKKPWLTRDYFSVTAWTVAVAGSRPQRLTPWRNGLQNEPASFSPDGKVLLLDRKRTPFVPSEVLARDLRTGKTRVVARNAEEPTFSPDGSRIALISYRDRIRVQTADGAVPVGELYVVDANGSGLRRLTHTEEIQESDPSWDPSGARLAFISGGGGLGSGSSVAQINADGSCQRLVLGPGGHREFNSPALYGPAWQPGPGRGAGPIPC